MSFVGAAVAGVLGAVAAWGNPMPPPESALGKLLTPDDPTASIFGQDTACRGCGPPGSSLDKEIIRRIIRRHINDVKSCYEPELAAQPLLGGRIMVQFTIDADGNVIASELQDSTMGSPRVEYCTVQTVRRWQFPKPRGGGVVVVSYPFVLSPAPILIFGVRATAGSVEIEHVNPQVLVHRSMDANGVPANGVVALTPNGLLLVDTGWTAAQTEVILNWGSRIFRRPWIGAVITHDHPDRDGGMDALVRHGIPVAALDLTVAKLARRGVRGVSALFSARDTMFDDRRGFQAFYPGPGHTTDNMVVAFPASKVVFGGCLIKSADAGDLGFTGDADLSSWPSAVRRVAQRYPDMMVVPGHGAVAPPAAPYDRTQALLAAAKK